MLMVDLGARIRRKVYKFELKRKYQYTGHYRIKERPPLERIKDQVRAMLAPKKQEKKIAAAPVAAQPPKGGFNFIVFGAFIFIALIILGLAWLYLTTQVLQSSAGVFQPQLERSFIENTISGGEILTTGDRNSPKHIASVTVDYDTSELKNYTVQLSTYDAKIPSEVFILDSEKIEASNYSEFIRILRSNLGKRKIMVNPITITQLETMPEGAVVIIPSGTIPKEILGFDSQITLTKLAERGVVVVYIGKPFNQMLNGTLETLTPKDTLQNLPLRFDESASLQSTGGFHLFQPLYRVIPVGGWTTDLVYGSVSVARRGDGAFIFIPQTLDGGWRTNASSAADDISRIVFETPWADPNAEVKNYTFVNQTTYAGHRSFFSEPFDSPNATVKVEFTGYPPASNFPVQQTLYIRLDKQRNNGLFIEQSGVVVPTNITNEPIRINAQLREPVAAQPNMELVLFDENGTQVQNFPQGNVNVQADRSFDVPIYVDRGEYTLKLQDDESNVYAETYMKVVSIDIKRNPAGDPQKRSIYVFDITMDGSPRSLSDVSVRVDNGTYGTYHFSNVDRVKVDVGQYTGNEILPLGQHTFEFTSGGLKTTVMVEHTRARTIFDEPIFWITILLAGGLVGIGVVFARQESVFFSIDIPDFPPVARTKIPLSADAVLGVFEKVNENYRWQNTPLTTAEIKNGFKDVFYQGKPIYITDYNVEYLLEGLEKKGKVKESLNYYGLVDWENKSGRSIEYLALMRRLRDICVNNAIPFTGIGESKEADSIITVVGQQMAIHFYEKGTDATAMLSRVIKTIGKGIAIIMFRSPADKEYLQNMINSSPTVAPLIVKMEADSSSLLFLTSGELEKMLIEFKSM
jgi:hypothetical protein